MNSANTVTLEKITKKEFSQFRIGDVVKVHRRVKEGSKERIQIIEGEIISRKHGKEPGSTFTLRRFTLGVGVELVLPIYSPQTEKIEIVKRRKVRRAKLYYLREQRGKKGRLKENREATRKIRIEQMEKANALKNEKVEEKKKEGKSE